jgi:hypothetical protein
MGVYVCIYIVFPYYPQPFSPNMLNSWLSFGFLGFLMPTAESSLSSRIPDLWYADALPSALALTWLCFGPCDPLLCDRSPIPCRDSGFRDSHYHEQLSSQSPNYRTTDAVLCVLSHQAKPLDHMTIIRHDHSFVPPPIGVSDIAMPKCMNPVSTGFPISRYASSWHVSLFWLYRGPCDLLWCDRYLMAPHRGFDPSQARVSSLLKFAMPFIVYFWTMNG